MSFEWKSSSDAEKRAEIEKLDALGHKSESIAETLGTSKNALVGWAWRNKMTISNKVISRSIAPPEAFVPDKPHDPMAFVSIPGSAPVTLVELGDNCCHWPVGEGDGSKQMFCGLPSNARYCDVHKQKSIVKKKQRPVWVPAAILNETPSDNDEFKYVEEPARKAGAE